MGVALLCVAALGMVSCRTTTTTKNAGGGATTGTPAEDRVTIRLAASSQSGGYPTPFGAVRGPGALMTTFMFDQLAFPDVTGNPKPWLAKSWDTSADGKTWTFHLQPNAKWTDGQPVTADDVAFTFDYDLKGPGASLGLLPTATYIDSVTAPDPATVVVQLNSVRPTFLIDVIGSFSGLGIIPKHIWSTVTDPAHFQGDQAVIGSGPYKLAKFDPTNNTFDLVANDDFYLGKPKVKEVQIIQVGDPLLALQQNQLDAAATGNGQSGTGAVPQSQIDALTKNYKELTAKGEFNVALFFNQAQGFPYDQKAFRQAVAYGLDRKDMLQRLVNGAGVPGSAGGLGPANPVLNKSLPDYAHDTDKAKAMLDQVGLKDANGDGVRDQPDGSPFSIPLLTSSSDSTTAQLVSENLRDVGLKVDITAVDQPTSDARDTKGDYQMAIVHFGGLSGDPNALVNRFASTSKSSSFTRVKGYKSPTFDQLAADQATTLDPAKRRQLTDQMQSILADDLPQLSLYVPDQIAFVNAKVFNGWAYTPGCPPCGVSLNKRMLVSGNADPVPG
ncbi:MAG: ABC transporter substrate-binding protein [Actinomycetota bacterium]|nr:ABC transporter substrate-binding protein [Actinomycetota bacterium]